MCTIEQDVRTWTVPPDPFYTVDDFPLMRIRDIHTGDGPDSRSGAMHARSPRACLDTRTARKHMLTVHADYRIWTPTPFLSFTDSPSDIEVRAEKRLSSRGSQILTVINGNTRRHKGLPLLKSKDEMMYYGVRDPYSRNYQYYQTEYLCLWEVSVEEIVAHLSWDDVRKDPAWYENTILPAFHGHERLRRASNPTQIPQGPTNTKRRYIKVGCVERELFPDERYIGSPSRYHTPEGDGTLTDTESISARMSKMMCKSDPTTSF